MMGLVLVQSLPFLNNYMIDVAAWRRGSVERERRPTADDWGIN